MCARQQFAVIFLSRSLQKLIRPLVRANSDEPAEAFGLFCPLRPAVKRSRCKAVKPTVNLLDAYGLRKDQRPVMAGP